MIRRKSRQREKIFSLINSSHTHPTAQFIYDTLRKEIPNISLGNIYRNLKILMEEEKIVKRDFGDNVEHYDAITSTHYHFICEKCNKVSDFKLPIQTSLIKRAQKISGNLIKGHSIEFFGICNLCVRRNK